MNNEILYREFAKITNDTSSNESVVTTYGTIVVEDNTTYVKLDGSDELTPVDMAMDADDGDRVLCQIKDHNVTITGNIDKPAQSLESESAQETIQEKVEAAISGIGVGLKVYYAPELPTGVKFNKDDTWYKTDADDATKIDGLYVFDGDDWVQQEFTGGILREGTVTANEIDVNNLCSNIAFIGPTDGRHVRVNSDGIHMFASGDVEGTNEIAHFGYGEGAAREGTLISPYYSLGLRRPEQVIGIYSNAEGYITQASGPYSHAEGTQTTAMSMSSHAEGSFTYANGVESHSEGYNTTANGQRSHTEGLGTTAEGTTSHAEGYVTTAFGDYSHSEGYNTTAGGEYSHAQNFHTIAAFDYMTAIGKYNTYNNSAFAIGNGTDNDNRSDAFTVDWDGNVECSGGITASGAISGATVNGYTLGSACAKNTGSVASSNAGLVTGGQVYSAINALITTGSHSADNISVSACGSANTTVAVTKSGYTPIGIISFNIAAASSSGLYPSAVHVYKSYISGNNAVFYFGNNYSKAAKIKVTFTVLYEKS